MLQFSSSQFSNLRWRYFVESLLLKSTPNVSSVVLSSARVAGVDRADARASSVAREPPRFFGETAALRVAGFLAAGFLAGDFLTAGFYLRRGVEEEIRRGAGADRGGEQDRVEAHQRGAFGALASRPSRRRHFVYCARLEVL